MEESSGRRDKKGFLLLNFLHTLPDPSPFCLARRLQLQTRNRRSQATHARGEGGGLGSPFPPELSGGWGPVAASSSSRAVVEGGCSTPQPKGAMAGVGLRRKQQQRAQREHWGTRRLRGGLPRPWQGWGSLTFPAPAWPQRCLLGTACKTKVPSLIP